MKKTVQEFIKAQNNMFSFFNVDDKFDFFIKPMLNYNWYVKNNDDFFIVSYWLDDNCCINDAVVVKKNKKPLIYKTRDYTMVIAIECVRIGFVFKNTGEMCCER